MPSIAVIKSDMGHGNYGECSFVFDKSTIDPKTDKRNKVYGGDAWTPTYPAIEYKVSEKIADKARRIYTKSTEKKSGVCIAMPLHLKMLSTAKMTRTMAVSRKCSINYMMMSA